MVNKYMTWVLYHLLVLLGFLKKDYFDNLKAAPLLSEAVQKVIYVMSSEARHLSINMNRPLASLEVTAFF